MPASSESSRFLGGDDAIVKSWDVAGENVVLSVGKETLGSEAAEDRILSVGLDGYMKVFDYGRMKITHSMRFLGPLIIAEPERGVLKPTYFRYFHRGQSEKPAEGDFLVMRSKKVKLAEHDKLLKKFRHKDALVAVLSRKNPKNVVVVMEELVARKKLLKCVSNLDGEELGLLLMFLCQHATSFPILFKFCCLNMFLK
ncbi:hypothetical protein COLO4_19838 [Corchorus olitorius]|uniref:U3 small nucleolar RNA-associated protein 15 C-terminal domain-containing protein n=1 Tax=Corchorus olitorius TaxID=93759 RepID=A0A1R3J346_9ROSI|nr:hypothetical protein COLO4_19838 [Corchorus olitorius]